MSRRRPPDPPAAGRRAPAYTSTGFIWPFYGPISTYFSGYHRGIDIDGFGNYGATIVRRRGRGCGPRCLPGLGLRLPRHHPAR